MAMYAFEAVKEAADMTLLFSCIVLNNVPQILLVRSNDLC